MYLKLDCSEEDLKKFLAKRHDEKYGTIESVQLIKKKDEKGNKLDENKGFGFVIVSNEDMADKMAIQNASFDFGGRKIELKKSVPTEGKGGMRGGRGGRGGMSRGGMRGGGRGGGGYGGSQGYYGESGGYGGYGGGSWGGYGGYEGYGYEGYGSYPPYGGGYAPQAPRGRGRGRYAPY